MSLDQPHVCPAKALVELIRLITTEGLEVRVGPGRNVVPQMLQDAADLLLHLGHDPHPAESPGPVSTTPAGA